MICQNAAFVLSLNVEFFGFVQPLTSLNSLQTLRKKAMVNLTALQTYEMEADALSK